MNAVRLTYDKPPREVRIPDEFMRRPLEIIIMALGEDQEVPRSGSRPSRLAAYAGKWQGGELVRESQGEYEARREFE